MIKTMTALAFSLVSLTAYASEKAEFPVDRSLSRKDQRATLEGSSNFARKHPKDSQLSQQRVRGQERTVESAKMEHEGTDTRGLRRGNGKTHHSRYTASQIMQRVTARQAARAAKAAAIATQATNASSQK